MEKRSFNLFCPQELLNNKHIRHNRVRILQSQCTEPTALVTPAAPEPPLLHACPTGKLHGSLPYAQLQPWKAHLSLSKFSANLE